MAARKAGPPTPAAKIRQLQRENRELRGHLATLTGAVTTFLALLDQEMEAPSTPERGKRIAALANKLDLANDRARYFGLGVDYRRDDKDAIRQDAVARAVGGQD